MPSITPGSLRVQTRLGKWLRNPSAFISSAYISFTSRFECFGSPRGICSSICAFGFEETTFQITYPCKTDAKQIQARPVLKLTTYTFDGSVSPRSSGSGIARCGLHFSHPASPRQREPELSCRCGECIWPGSAGPTSPQEPPSKSASLGVGWLCSLVEAPRPMRFPIENLIVMARLIVHHGEIGPACVVPLPVTLSL